MLRKFFIPVCLFLGSLVLYLHNLSHSVYGGDVGDLVTAAFVGGVPHAPGYPLFTIIGFLLTRLSFFSTPAFALGLISVVSGAVSVVVFYQTLRLLKISVPVAIVATLTLATNYLFWFYNEIAEVFSLNTFFIFCLFFLALLFRGKKKAWQFFLFCFVLALSCTHHQTIALFIPGFLLLIASPLWQQRKKWKVYLWSIPIFLCGLLPYLYVPIAASHMPVINWDTVHDIPSFFHLLLRKDYGTFDAGGYSSTTFLQRLIILKSYFSTILYQTTIPVCVISILGIWSTFKKYRPLSIALLLSFIVAGPLFIAYAGFPLVQNFFFGVNERFFTMSAILIMYFFAFGLEFFVGLLTKLLHRPLYATILPLIFLLIPLQLFFYNFPKTNLSHVWTGDNLGYDMLAPLPQNAVVLLSGDTPLFNTWYMHYARHIRPDVEVVDIAMLDMDPLMRKEKKIILSQNSALQKNTPLLTVTMVKEIAKNRPIFSALQLQGDKDTLTWIPYGLVYELVPKGQAISQEEFTKRTHDIWQSMHLPTQSGKVFGSYTLADIPGTYAHMLLATGAYFWGQYQNSSLAKQYYEKAIAVEPNDPKAYEALGVYYLTDTNNKNCISARDNFASAIAVNPTEELAHLLLYSTYRECLHDYQKANIIAKDFQNMFGENIFVALKKTITTKKETF